MEITSFTPELELDRADESALASIVSQPGWKVFEKIGKVVADQFILKALNTDATKEADMVIRMRMAQVAAQYHTMLFNIVSNTVTEYIHSQPSDKPIESAEAIDIGEYSRPGYAEGEPLF